ncbi:MAG: hypothetical protein KC635_05830 [Myxococcales bacterium]|nr:hypothetical protein [Myxococcales bacterium]MCB9735678.1 hypothetical protein [Deltaproteobacteria bacterium]
MRVALQLGVGAIFTTLLLVVPALHAVSWLGVHLDAVAWALVALPFAVLLAAAGRGPLWAGLFAWPVAHLPALVAVPALSDRSLYTGLSGFVALAAVALLGVAWFLSLLWPSGRAALRPPGAPRRPGPHALVLLAHALSVGVFGAFALAATRSPDTDVVSANLILVIGVVVAFVVAGRWVAADLGGVVLEPASAARYRARLLVRRRVSRRSTALTAVAVVVSVLLLVLWYLSGVS